MDPYRNRSELPPLPEEPVEEPDLEEDAGVFFMRRFRRKWITLTLLSWVLATVLLVPGQLIALGRLVGGSWEAIALALLVEAIHALVYLSPLWAWGVARDEVRRESWGVDLGGWIISGSLPRWFFWMVPASIPISAVALLGMGLGGFVVARMAYLIVWLSLCVTMLGQVGVLRLTRAEDDKQALEVEDRHRRRVVELESFDAEKERVQFLVDGQSMSWRIVSPLGKLERDVKKWMARKT